MRLLRVGLVVFAVLVLTGLGLMSFYAPTTPQLVARSPEHNSVTLSGILRGTHFWAAHILGLVLLLHLLALIVRRGAVQVSKWKSSFAAVWLLLLAVVLWFTGLVLPWDALTYWLTELARQRGIRLSLLQVYWAHLALLPIVFGISAFFYVRSLKRANSPLFLWKL